VLILLTKMYSGIPMIGISNWYIMISRKVIIGKLEMDTNIEINN